MNNRLVTAVFAILLAGSCLVIGAVAFGQDDNIDPRWRNPRYAKFLAGRMSNEQLLEAPRVSAVFELILVRNGFTEQQRSDAIKALVALNETDEVTELIAALGRADAAGMEAMAALHDVAHLLQLQPPAKLKEYKGDLWAIATEGEQPMARHFAYVALVVAAGSAEPVWAQAAESDDQLADLLDAIPLIPQAKTRATLYPKVAPLLEKAPSPRVRQAAISAVVAMPGHETQTFKTLARFVREDIERASAISGIQRINPRKWPAEELEPLAAAIVTYAQSVPAKARTKGDFLAAVQLGNDLAAKLDDADGQAVRDALGELGVKTILLRTVKHQMAYDKTVIVVLAGKPVEIVLDNIDLMQHNLVIVKPEALAEVGQAAEDMSTDTDAMERNYLPESDKILHSIRVLEAGQKDKVNFTAPQEPGFYPYLCTFPGHWRQMFGTMVVAKDKAEAEHWLANPDKVPSPLPANMVVHNWTVEELKPALAKLSGGRSFENGKRIFSTSQCATCHKIGQWGGGVAPDLTEVAKKYKPEEVLREIIEPGAVISEGYEVFNITYEGGDYGEEEMTGVKLKTEGDKIVFSGNMLDAKDFVELTKSEILSEKAEPGSLMPIGQLSPLDEEQILDLIAFLISGGDESHAAFKP